MRFRHSVYVLLFLFIACSFTAQITSGNDASSRSDEDIIKKFERDGNLTNAITGLSFETKLGQMSIASLYTFWKVEDSSSPSPSSSSSKEAENGTPNSSGRVLFSNSAEDSLSYHGKLVDECSATEALLEMKHLRKFLRRTKVGAFVADPPPMHKSLRQFRESHLTGNNATANMPTAAQLGRWSKGRLNAADWRCVSIILHELSTQEIGIPVMLISRGDHGAALVHGATIFPQLLASISSFNIELVEKMSSITAKDTRLSGAQMIFAPCLEVSAHPAWAHYYQCMGEDTYIAAVMGVAITAGLQGYPTSINNNVKVAASFSHFIAAGQAINGQDGGPANVPMTSLLNIHLPPYAAAIAAGIRCGTVSTNELNSVPNAISNRLTRKLLRNELSFNGTLISDVTTIEALHQIQHVAHSKTHAIHLAIEDGGVDASLAYNTNIQQAHSQEDHYESHSTNKSRPTDSNLEFISSLTELVRAGKISTSRIEESVKRVMQLKYDLGLLSPPLSNTLPSMGELLSTVGTVGDRAVALGLARESIILLENDNHLLPLTLPNSEQASSSASSLSSFSKHQPKNSFVYDAVVDDDDDETDLDDDGHDTDTIDNADEHVPMKDRIRFPRLPSDDIVKHRIGSKASTVNNIAVIGPCANSLAALSGGMTIHEQGAHANHEFAFGATILEALKETSRINNIPLNITYAQGVTLHGKWLPESVERAKNYVKLSDVAIVCLGEGPYWGSQHGDTSLELPASQQRLINELSEIGTDIILVLIEGRPRILCDIKFRSNIRAVLLSFLPGPEGGQAIIETIFGYVNPSARLPISYPKTVDTVLPYFHTFSQQSQYNPQWSFGHGLSYSRFSYSDLRLSSSHMEEDRSLTAEVTVTNDGPYDGQETVLLYVTDLYRSIAPEVRRVKGFEKIALQVSQSQTVRFELTMDSLTFYSDADKRIVEAGDFCVTISSLSECFRLDLNDDVLKRSQPSFSDVQKPAWWPYAIPPPAISINSEDLELQGNWKHNDLNLVKYHKWMTVTPLICGFILGMVTCILVILMKKWITDYIDRNYFKSQQRDDASQTIPLMTTSRERSRAHYYGM